MGDAAQKITVEGFRQIFHWPLSLADPDQAGRVFNAAAKNLDPWTQTSLANPSYEEAVYFHDFVQDFLYSRDDDTETRLHFRRSDLRTITFTVDEKDQEFVVEDLTLDMFRFGSAVITLHLKYVGTTNLHDAQTMIDHIRRAFPGFWFDGQQNGKLPGLCPSAARIDNNHMQAITRADANRHLHTHNAPKLFDWWQGIAAPLKINDGDEHSWRHVLDERIPVMSYIHVANDHMRDGPALSRISDGDWYRIAAADQAGYDDMPYNPGFLQNQSAIHFYDRFFPDATISEATRHCFAGYHYAMVGAGDFFQNIAENHFTGHYRQMVFIAHLEFATMLTFSRRITNLIATGDKQNFADDLHTIRRDLLDFKHRFHFTHVSNHLQAREMNSLLRKSLDLEALAHDVEAELNSASDFAMAQEQGKQARSQGKLTRSQARLTEFATLFLPATLAAGFCGMNFLAGSQNGTPLTILPAMTQFFGWGALAYLLAGLCLLWTRGSGRTMHEEERRLIKQVGIVTVVLGGAYVALRCWGCLP